MTTSEKAVEVLKSKYGIDARIYKDNVYLSVWNDELSDTIDAEVSSKQVLEWASEYITHNMKYARKCSITHKGMNEGWIDEQTDEYFKNKVDAVKHIKELMDEEIANGGVEFANWKSKNDDDILEIGYNHYGVYYTEWECTGDYQYEEINGVLTEIE